MTTQPEALRLADELTKYLGGNTATQAAKELRRLHEENELLARACDKIRVMHREEIKPLLDVHSLNLELLEALRALLSLHEDPMPYDAATTRAAARAAIKKAEGKE
jgi:tRNA(Ile)-lysidine synthase TilS/MesJ